MHAPAATPHPASRRWLRWAAPVCLVLLVALFLFPYLALGRSLVPFDLIPRLQPWASHRSELFPDAPPVHNPLLDSLQQYYPRRVYFQGAVRGGWLPFWEPHVYAGSPFLAAQQGAVLYPPAWALALLPPGLQFGWSALFHMSLAALGTWLFLRRMGIGPAAAAGGGAAFALNGFGVVWLAYPNVAQWTLSWLPLALWAWESARDGARHGRRPGWLALCGGLLALGILGGHGQSSAYMLLVWGSWSLARCLATPERWRALGRGVAVPAALAIGLSLGHLLPSLDYLPRTDRAARLPWAAVVKNGMPPEQLWTFLVPRLFGDETELTGGAQTWMPVGDHAQMAWIERSFYPGAAVLVLAAGGLAWTRRRRNTTADALQSTDDEAPFASDQSFLARYSVGLALCAVLMAMGTPLYWLLWQFAPGFGNFTAVARIVCIAGWGLACLAALGIQGLCSAAENQRAPAGRNVAIAGGVAALIVGAAWFLKPVPLPLVQALGTEGAAVEAAVSTGCGLALVWTLVPVGLALVAMRARPQSWLGAAAAVLIAADLAAFGMPFNPATDPGYAARSTPELAALRGQSDGSRFLSVGPPGQELLFRQRLPSNLGAALGLAEISGSDSFVSKRYREWESATQAAGGGQSPFNRVPTPNLRSAAVGLYLLTGRGAVAGLEPLAGEGVWRDPGALPYARVHLMAQALAPEAVLANLAQPNREPRVALIEGSGAPSFEGPARVIPFTARHLNGNRISIEGESPAPGLLVVAESIDPARRCRVDGRLTRIFPADHLLIGVPVSGGRHRIELRYEPETYRVGAFLSGLALAVFAAMLTIGWRSRRSG